MVYTYMKTTNEWPILLGGRLEGCVGLWGHHRQGPGGET